MRTFPILMTAAMWLPTTAGASHTIDGQAAVTAVKMPPASATAVVPELNVPPPTETAAKVDGAAAAEAPHPTEPGGRDIDAQTVARDPWEGFNRQMHGFNTAADNLVLRPLAVGYKKIAPEPVQAGVSRFFANLSMPATVVNQALQGRPGDAATSLGRFVVNTTVGIVGLFDPASHFGLAQRDGEDFGQTLATWGWRDSRYLVLPLLGPRTVRDALGMVGDRPLSPVGQIQDSGVASGLQALEIVDVRTRLLPVDQFRRDALDDYVFVRDAWTQRRSRQITQDLRSGGD